MQDHLMAGAKSLIPVPGLGGLGGRLGDLGKTIGGFAGGNLGDAISGGVKHLSGMLPDSLSGAFGDLGGGMGGLIGKGVDFATSHPDELLAGAQGLYGAYAANKANNLRGKSLRSAEGAYNERAPLRRMGMAGLTNPMTPNVSGLSDPNNPYALKRMGGLR
jgi:hypothetical protein